MSQEAMEDKPFILPGIPRTFLTRWVPFSWPQVVPYCMSTHSFVGLIKILTV